MTFTFEERAEMIWRAVKSSLDDRGCFNGIDTDVMKELDAAMVELIVNKLGRQEHLS